MLGVFSRLRSLDAEKTFNLLHRLCYVHQTLQASLEVPRLHFITHIFQKHKVIKCLIKKLILKICFCLLWDNIYFLCYQSSSSCDSFTFFFCTSCCFLSLFSTAAIASSIADLTLWRNEFTISTHTQSRNSETLNSSIPVYCHIEQACINHTICTKFFVFMFQQCLDEGVSLEILLVFMAMSRRIKLYGWQILLFMEQRK